MGSEADESSPRDIISTRGAQVLLSLHHLEDITSSLLDSLLYLEHLLRTQLVAAIGRDVSTRDVVQYAQYYAHKLFEPSEAPAPLAHAVRRSSKHSPEGVFSIQQTFPPSPASSSFTSSETSLPVPLFALSRQVASSSVTSQMSFQIDASTHVQFSGDQFVHAYLHPSFSSSSSSYQSQHSDEAKLTFTASARQFSSFVLLLGKVSGRSTFEPVHAVVVRDKDEVGNHC